MKISTSVYGLILAHLVFTVQRTMNFFTHQNFLCLLDILMWRVQLFNGTYYSLLVVTTNMYSTVSSAGVAKPRNNYHTQVRRGTFCFHSEAILPELALP